MNQLWRPPQHPPNCDCGCCREAWDHCRDTDWRGLCESWDQADCLKRIILQVLQEQGLLPGTGGGGGSGGGSGGGTGGTTLTGPITGVTDGSQAATGMVGEFITGSQTQTVTTLTGVVNWQSTPITVPPGDWDIEASVATQYLTYDGIQFFLTQTPTGMSSNALAWTHPALPPVGSSQPLWGLLLPSPRAQGTFSVATPLTFTINLAAVSITAGGTAQITTSVTGRRMR